MPHTMQRDSERRPIALGLARPAPSTPFGAKVFLLVTVLAAIVASMTIPIAPQMQASAEDKSMPNETLPSFAGAVEWVNSKPLTATNLHGKVVLVEFWTYTCINWLRTLPYVRAWADKYKIKAWS